MYMTLVTAVLIFDVRNKLNLGVMVVKPPWGDTIYELFIKYSFLLFILKHKINP